MNTNLNFKIIENFLEDADFNNIKNFLMSYDCPWYYRDYTSDKKDPSYFTYCFFNNDRIESPAFNLIQPLLNNLNYSSIIQIRANLSIKQDKPTSVGWHVDYPYKNFKTAIYYINNTNGPTVIDKKKQIKIDHKENKVLIMDGDTEHKAILQTDEKRRINININYYEKI